jgi:hypothetical protein
MYPNISKDHLERQLYIYWKFSFNIIMHLPIFKFKVQPLNMSSYIYQISLTLIVQKQWHSKFKLGNLGACGVWIEPQIYKELNPLQHKLFVEIFTQKNTPMPQPHPLENLLQFY